MRTTLKFLVYATLGLSLLPLLWPELLPYLILSRAGIEHLYLWQPLTYVFVQPGPISFGFFIELAFNLYVLWTFGGFLLERLRPHLFLALYFGSTLLAALTALTFPNAHLAGSSNAIFTLLFCWMLLNSGAQLLLFFTIPFKAQWLVLGLIGVTLFIDIANSNWIGFSTLVTSLLFGYLFTLIAFRNQSPFPLLRPLERTLLRLFEKKNPTFYHHSKIFDIKSGSPVLDDEKFMDAMLDKISRHGENSLSSAEKKRMKNISEKKK